MISVINIPPDCWRRFYFVEKHRHVPIFVSKLRYIYNQESIYYLYICRSLQHIGKSYMHTHTYIIFPKNISKNERHRHIHSYISFVFYTIYF